MHSYLMTAEDGSARKAEEERRRQEVVHMFRSAPFEEIVACSEAKVCNERK